jgi:hypothetical protein
MAMRKRAAQRTKSDFSSMNDREFTLNWLEMRGSETSFGQKKSLGDSWRCNGHQGKRNQTQRLFYLIVWLSPSPFFKKF